MTAPRRWPAGMSEALADLDPLPRDAERFADLEGEVEDLRGALRKIAEVAGCDGSAPALLDLVKQVAELALRGAR